MADDVVKQRLEFDADQALQTLKAVDEQATTVAGKAALLNKALQDYARQLGQTWKTTLVQMKESMGTGSNQFSGFTVSDQQGQTIDVTRDVLKQTEALARNAQAKNKFVTEDSKATSAEMNFDGSVRRVNASVGEQSKRLQVLATELNRIQAAGGLKLTGSNLDRVTSLKNIIRDVSSATGAQYGEVSKQLQQMGVPAAQAQAAVKGLNAEMTKGTKSAQGFSRGIDFVRTALGTLTAVGIFGFITALTTNFKTAVKAARDLEDSLFRLSNVEKILSEGGIEVSLKGLKDGIREVKELFPIFSQEDATQLVAQIAISTKELGFQEKQVIELAKAVSILNIRSTEEETASQTAQKVISAMITDNARGISSLGLSFKEMELQAKGVELGFLSAGEAASNLTNEEKAQVKYNIILENTGDELQNVGEYMDSNTAKIKANAAAWHDLLTTMGQGINNLIPEVSGFLNTIQQALEVGRVRKLFTEAFKGVELGEKGGFKDFAINWKLIFGVELAQDEYDRLKEVLSRLSPEEIKRLFPDPSAIKDRFARELIESLIPDPDTVTSAIQTFSQGMDSAAEAVQASEEKISDIMADAREKRQKIDADYRRKIEDANRDHAQKLQDIARDVERKQEDALRNYNQKVEDVNRNADEKIADANANARQRELDREAEFQRRLRELRERFLFDLEDALRERDARQVLRLIREYNLDKKNLLEKRKLDQQEAKKDLARKLEDIERERQLKLEAARRDLAEKQAEIALWAERERNDAAIALQRKLADARQWHQRELQEYQQYLKRKLEELAKAIIKEYQLTAAGAQAIYSLLNGYFGSGGAIDNLLSQGLTANLNGILSTSGSGGGGQPTVSPTWATSGHYMAEGGTYVATKPTKAIFGERGPEVATFTPIGRTGQDVNKIFGDVEGGGGGNSIDLRVSLSRDLIAEVVDTSLESVALHLERLNRER